MSPTSYQAALPRVIPSLLSATLIIIPYSNSFVKRVRKVFLQRKQRTKTWLLTFFPESQQPRQFTPLREGRHMATCFITISYYFNSRPSARGDLSDSLSQISWRHFNSRPSARGDQILKRHPIGKPISIHAPPRGATFGIVELDNSKIFQFTPLREGRPHTPSWTSSAAISIHAPPRGATPALANCHRHGGISIHAPPRGATTLQKIKTPLTKFQFTPLREG